ncbi:MAG: MBL fold metallo-hydrolase [Pseudomonadota bacterium]|nr:MBL fold metallo-hydrolase [Pseudomonadota bacterium]
MLGYLKVWLLALLLSASLLAGCVSTDRSAVLPASAPALARITVLYDAFGKDPALVKDWGYAALVEIQGKRILFDTGDDPAVFAANVRAKGVDLTRLDFVVMSHRHGDHMGGLTHLLALNPNVRIYAPKEPFGVYGSSLPGTFYRKSEALPPEMRYYGGKPPEMMRFGTAFPGANIQLIDKTTEVAPGFTLIALVSDAPGTRELKELSLAISTPEGMVLVVGCSHPGIEAILAEAVKIDPHIHLIAGGLHLVVAQDAMIQMLAAALHDTWRVDYLAPGHCTGEATFAELQRVFGDRYLYAGLGSVLGLGADPRLGAARVDPGVVGGSEYRRLLAASDDAAEAGGRAVLSAAVARR